MIIHTYPLNFISGITAFLAISITFYILYRYVLLERKIKPDSKYLNFFILFIFIFASFLRVHSVFKYNRSLWDDEARTYVTVRVSSVRNVLEMKKTFLPDSGPLDLVIRHFFMRFFGDSIISYMFPSVVFSILGLFVVFELSRRFLNKAESSVVLTFMALNFLEIYYSASGRNYAILTLLVPLNALLFLNALESNRKIDWFFYLLTLVLCFYSHFIILSIFPIHGLYVAFLGFKDWKSNKSMLLKFFLTITTAFILFLPLLISYFPRYLRFTSTASVPHSYFVLSLIGTSITTFIIITLVLIKRKRIGKQREVPLLLYCYIVIGYYFTFFAIYRYATFHRYFHYLLPFALILLFTIFSGSVRAAQRLYVKKDFLNKNQLKIILIVPTLLLLTLLYNHTVLQADAPVGVNHDGNWKSASNYLIKNLEGNDKIIVFDFMLSNISVYTDLPLYCTYNIYFFDIQNMCSPDFVKRVNDLAGVNWNTIDPKKIESDASNYPAPRYWLVDPVVGSFYRFPQVKKEYVDKLTSLGYSRKSGIEFKNLSIDLYEK